MCTLMDMQVTVSLKHGALAEARIVALPDPRPDWGTEMDLESGHKGAGQELGEFA